MQKRDRISKETGCVCRNRFRNKRIAPDNRIGPDNGFAAQNRSARINRYVMFYRRMPLDIG